MKLTLTKIVIILMSIVVITGVFIYGDSNIKENKIDKFIDLILKNEEYGLSKKELVEYKNEIQDLEIDENDKDMLQKQYFYLGYIESLLGEDDESEGYFKLAYDLGENSDPITHLFMVNALAKSKLQENNKEEAFIIFKESVEFANEINYDIVAKLYQAYARNLVTYCSDVDFAINLMNEAIAINSSPETKAYNYLYRSVLYLAAGNYYDSIKDTVFALEISMSNKLEDLKAASIKSLGDIYYVQGKYNQAIGIYEEILSGSYKLNITDELGYLAYLSDCYVMINKFDLAENTINKFIIVLENVSYVEKAKELNWIYLLQTKLNILKKDFDSAKKSIELANYYYNIAPQSMFANVDIWAKQLSLDFVLIENDGDSVLLDKYIELLDEMSKRGVKDDLYNTIRDRVIYLGDILKEDTLTTMYRKEKIQSLVESEEVNYDTELIDIIEALHHEESAEVIISLRTLVVFFLGFGIFLIIRVQYVKATRKKIKKMSLDLYKQSITDYLTTAYNRKYLIEYVADLLTIPNRITCILIDIDYFKLYNDTYGHIAGDKILQEVVQLLKKVFNEDAVFRYGGEEFCVISTNNIEDFEVKVKLLYQELLELNIEHKASKVAKYITLSSGIHSEVLNDINELQCFLIKVDEKLYKAKELGRNQFII